jgi:iron complex transport system permease protein
MLRKRPSRPAALRERLGPGLRIALLAVLAAVVVVVFLTIDVHGYWEFILPRRLTKLAAMVLMAYAVATSTVLFQTITSNRILTPSLMGFDALYLLLQTVLVFVFSSRGLLVLDERLRFGLEVVLMAVFATALFTWLFGSGRYGLHLLILVGIVFGTFFRSVSSFLQRLIEPSEFVILQDRFFASFNAVPQDLLLVATLLIGGVSVVAVRRMRQFDVLALGREHATNLGIDYRRSVMVILVLIAVMVSVSTALVGPITFFGLLVANLAYLVAGSHRHAVVIPVAALLAVITLVGGQLVLERVFEFDTSLSVIIEFLGGLVFLALLLRSTKRTLS